MSRMKGETVEEYDKRIAAMGAAELAVEKIESSIHNACTDVNAVAYITAILLMIVIAILAYIIPGFWSLLATLPLTCVTTVFLDRVLVPKIIKNYVDYYRKFFKIKREEKENK